MSHPIGEIIAGAVVLILLGSTLLVLPKSAPQAPLETIVLEVEAADSHRAAPHGEKTNAERVEDLTIECARGRAPQIERSGEGDGAGCVSAKRAGGRELRFDRILGPAALVYLISVTVGTLWWASDLTRRVRTIEDSTVTAERIARLETEVHALAESTRELKGSINDLVREMRR